jgi:type I restriction-modification system DNA methylase subunit
MSNISSGQPEKYAHLGAQPNLLDPNKKIENVDFQEKLFLTVANLFPGVKQDEFFARFPSLKASLENTTNLAQQVTEQTRKEVINLHVQTIIAKNFAPIQEKHKEIPLFIYEQLA